tara:strand:- start:143 stop:244 length:102 start_codon:yes stop_codon:yes gene_type:complete
MINKMNNNQEIEQAIFIAIISMAILASMVIILL